MEWGEPTFCLVPDSIPQRERDAVSVANIPDELRANADRSGDLSAVVFSSQSQVNRGLFLFGCGSHLLAAIAASIAARMLALCGSELLIVDTSHSLQ